MQHSDAIASAISQILDARFAEERRQLRDETAAAVAALRSETRIQSDISTDTGQLAWRPGEWARAAGVGKTTTFRLIKAKVIDARKRGKATLILTPPAEYLASLPQA